MSIARRSRVLAGLFSFLAVVAGVSTSLADPPTWDHVVVVIEENHALLQVLGNGSAPYLDSLAENGATLTSMFGITHPSQPNYLQFFSGSNQGVTTNNDTSRIAPFNTPNLGAELISAGKTFTGYSETMPSAGYTGFDAAGGLYARRHNPWVNWQSNDAPSSNHLAPSTNQPFSAFPTNFSTLPNVSIVVPNNANNMHDGTIQQGDTWLQNNLGAYADWAVNNNSLLIVTFDEDNSAARNRIPTVFYGAHVEQGAVVESTYTLHNLLHTIESSFGTTHAGASNDVRSIVGAFTTDPNVTVASFQQGTDGYTGATDTWIEQANPATAHGSDAQLVIDGSPVSQGLIKFDDIFGNGPGQVPYGATILSAKLSILTGSASNDQTANNMALHQLLVPFDGNSTWNSLAGGISLGSEAVTTPEFTLLPNTLGDYAIFDVSDSINAFAHGQAKNQGWLINPSGTDGWRPRSSNAGASDRPILQITYTVPEPATWVLAVTGMILSMRQFMRRGRCGTWAAA